ncbi:MAG: spermidine/putrescine ABC transporter substrate-binding protein [Gammaproteobacteria bacterium]|nr:spermidine/putrescine ABC transporter substrate-binding protein [Gammaproteobacteria bacterium]
MDNRGRQVRRFNRYTLRSCIFVFVALFYISPVYSAETAKELSILTWSEYLSADMVKAFEKKFNVKVKQTFYESDYTRDRILLETKGLGFDLILVNGITINNYRRQGWLQPLPSKAIPNTKYIDKRWLTAFDSAVDYGVPYFWGTLGIAYRKDLVSKPITSWMDLLKPEKELQGKILMVLSSRDLIGMGLKALGYSLNSNDINELNETQSLLMAQKPHVKKFGYLTLEKESGLVTGEIVAATLYGGDALNVAEHNENITYVLPEEGGNIWVDYFVLSADSSNTGVATNFLNFINEPKWAAVNAEELYLATPNIEAMKLLSKEVLEDPVIYPDKSLLNFSEFYAELSPKSSRKRASIFLHYTK